MMSSRRSLALNFVLLRTQGKRQLLHCSSSCSSLLRRVDGGSCAWCSTATQNTTSTEQRQSRIVRTLYKQLLRWCQRTDPELPLAAFVPPIQVTSPEQVEPHRLQWLSLQLSTNNNNNDHEPSEATRSVTAQVNSNNNSMLGDKVLLERILKDLPAHCRFLHHTTSTPTGGSAAATPTKQSSPSPQNIATSSMSSITLIAPVYYTTDLAHLMRCLFRLNSGSREYQKQRVSLAFEALKSLNELTVSRPYQELIQQHEQHQQQDAGERKYRVGQVVQHVNERWRGLVAGWEVGLEEVDDEKTKNHQQAPHRSSTSLTTKEYPTATTTSTTTTKSTDSERLLPRYHVLLDVTDAVLASGRTKPELLGDDNHDNNPETMTSPHLATASESELELVEEACLTRIRGSHICNFFGAYHAPSRTFVPNALVAYQYPVDAAAAARERASEKMNTTADAGNDHDNETRSILSDELEQQEQLCQKVIQTVKELCQHLENVLEEELQMWVPDTSIGGGEEPVLLSRISSRLNLLATGRHLEQPQETPFRHEMVSPAGLATSYLYEVLQLFREISSILWQRHICLEYADKVRFRVGDVVRHKRYNFRGVVVAWDPKPTVDVTLWDGLENIANPTELPFYQVIPDPYDCIRAFGSERGLRYVCEENLEFCPVESTDIEVDLDDPEWKREPRSDGGYRHIPPPQLLFKYAQDEKHSDPGAISSRCMDQIEKSINEWLWHVATATSTIPAAAPSSPLTLPNLITLGQICDSANDAKAVQEMIREIRLANQHMHLQRRVFNGIACLSAGKALEALELFSAVVEEDPGYAEAWHKKATCELILGKDDESVLSARMVLQLDPSHVGGLAGMGLYHEARGDYQKAIDCFRSSLTIDPWFPVASKLSACLDHASPMHKDSRAAQEGRKV